jgi:hypothetical protein
LEFTLQRVFSSPPSIAQCAAWHIARDNLGNLVAPGASTARNSTYEKIKNLRAQVLVTAHPKISAARR